MQNEQNTRQDETTLTEAEVSFARNLEKSLSLAMGEDDKVTSIWSRLKPEQRARIAEEYLAKLAETDPIDPNNLNSSAHSETISETDSAINTAKETTGQKPYSPPPGYPPDFNPLAGFPGLEPSRSGPSPEDIIAGALGTPNGATSTNPLDILRGLVPGIDTPTNLRQPIPDAPVPQEPAVLPDPPAEASPQADQKTPSQPQSDASLGPAAPNFWPLWIDQQDSLLKQCLKLMSGNMDDAQDALSEAMVKASTKFEDSMDEIRNHRAWLSRIVHNACIDLHRQNRRKAEYREETHSGADIPASPMIAPITPSPEESYLAGEKLDQLETALLAMQEKLRKPLLMRCVQDRTYDEIAAALGLSNCAVRKRVQLAREHLRTSGIQ